MSLKIKLYSAISAFVLILSLLIIGVFAANEQRINLKGNVDFNVADTTLYVKNIRVRNELVDEGTTISNFMPGFVNGSLDINLGTIENVIGTVIISIDVINTTSTTLSASGSGTLNNATYSASGVISGDSVSVSDVTTHDGLSGTIDIMVSLTGSDTTANVSLDGISIDFTEFALNVLSNNETYGTVSYSVRGENVTLTATLKNNSEFLGWAENTESGYVVSDLLDYTFPLSTNNTNSFVALFRSLGEIGTIYQYNQETLEAAAYLSDGASECPSDYVVASALSYDGKVYKVTSINGGLQGYGGSKIINLTLPSTITKLTNLTNGIDFCGGQNLDIVYLRSGFSVYEVHEDYLNGTIFDLFCWNDYTRASTFIVDSQYIYDVYHYYGGNAPNYKTIKFLQTIDDGSNAYINSSLTLTGTEVINGRTYNVYSV